MDLGPLDEVFFEQVGMVVGIAVAVMVAIAEIWFIKKGVKMLNKS